MDDGGAKIKAILHPVRARILVAMNDRALTPRQVAAQMDEIPLGTIYRHLNILLAAGLIQIVSERRVKGTVERQFALVHPSSLLNDVERAKLTADDIMGLVTVLTGVVQAAFQRYTRTATLPPGPGEVAFVTKSLYLTPDEYNAFRRELLGLLNKVDRKAGREYERRLIGYFSVPDPEIPLPPDTTE